jgi:hypothetical protein
MVNSEIKFKIKSTFDKVIKHWPKEISIYYSDDNARVFPELSLAWNRVEEVVGCNKPAEELMVWVIFSVLHERALKAQGDSTIKYIYPHSIPFLDFLKEYRNQLEDDEWNDLKEK